MFRVQLGAAGICVLIGVVLAAIQISNWHWLGAIGFVLAGCMAALIFLFLPDLVWEEWWYQLLAMIALVVGLLSVFLTSPATDIDLQKAQAELMEVFIMADSGQSVRLNATEQSLAEKGMQACAMQGTVDQSNLVAELYKAQHFGPTLTLADGVASTLETDRPIRCFDYYYALRSTKPEVFILFESQNPWAIPKQDRRT